MVTSLEEEWDVYTSRRAVARLLKEIRWSNRLGKSIHDRRNEDLRLAWRTDMIQYTAEQLVFLDGSIFKLQTGWRSLAYAPVGEEARYQHDNTRGDTWAILPGYSVDGYLDDVSVKKGYFNKEEFLLWLIHRLLPQCNRFPGPRSIICLDNLSIHHDNASKLDYRVKEAIESADCLIKYLPPYSPDYTPIELTFHMLKAWMRRYFNVLKRRFQGNFECFLRFAIENSQCDSKAREHFKYAAGGYRFEGDYAAYQRRLREFGDAQVEEHEDFVNEAFP